MCNRVASCGVGTFRIKFGVLLFYMWAYFMQSFFKDTIWLKVDMADVIPKTIFLTPLVVILKIVLNVAFCLVQISLRLKNMENFRLFFTALNLLVLPIVITLLISYGTSSYEVCLSVITYKNAHVIILEVENTLN